MQVMMGSDSENVYTDILNDLKYEIAPNWKVVNAYGDHMLPLRNAFQKVYKKSFYITWYSYCEVSLSVNIIIIGYCVD